MFNSIKIAEINKISDKKVEVELPDALEALRGAFGSGSGKKPSPGNSGITEKEVLDKLDLQIRLQVC